MRNPSTRISNENKSTLYRRSKSTRPTIPHVLKSDAGRFWCTWTPRRRPPSPPPPLGGGPWKGNSPSASGSLHWHSLRDFLSRRRLQVVAAGQSPPHLLGLGFVGRGNARRASESDRVNGLYPSRGGAKASIRKNRMGTPACRWARRRRGHRKWHEPGREQIVMARLRIAEL